MNQINSIANRIAGEIAARGEQVNAAIELLDGGATVPFIARYRKEATGGLDDTQLRTLAERLQYLRDLEDRRDAILRSIDEQGKLSPELKNSIEAALTKTVLEDLYLPYKPKRRTRAQAAREAGLEPLALGLYQDPSQDPETLAKDFLNAEHGITDVEAALEGARHILIERFAEDAGLIGALRERLRDQGVLKAKVIAGKEQQGAKYSDYFDFAEKLKGLPSHRLLALFRARAEGVLELELEPGAQDLAEAHARFESLVAHHVGIAQQGRAADRFLGDCVRLAWRGKLHVHLTLDLFGQAREQAELEAIRIFGDNLKDLLLAAPAGHRVVMGLDPGLRTGVKVAVVDNTGKLLATETIYPHAPKNQWDASIAHLAALATKHGVKLIAIGNGTASRPTDQLAGDLIKRHPELGLSKVIVSEAGASVYSASEVAAREFPELDVSLRGAVSIARRLQDPLAELVKIDPKAIGVGQYQHDVNQVRLGERLDAVVEDCVNAVGVDLNTASAALLARVSGLGPGLAENIVKHRDQHGAFARRSALLKVARLGPRAFEQCAGFLRIQGGADPLDASGVHPESYPVVERLLARLGKPMSQVLGDSQSLRNLRPEEFADERFGAPTVRDIIRELEKPGRDPRPEFKAADFKPDITEIEHLKEGMILEGVVSNVTAFGAFVDLGVHQDGLVHISQLSNKFIKDAREVVKAGQIVRVKVLEVELKRKRIALTMRLDEQPAERSSRTPQPAIAREARTFGKAADRTANARPATPTKESKPQLGALGAVLSAAIGRAQDDKAKPAGK